MPENPGRRRALAALPILIVLAVSGWLRLHLAEPRFDQETRGDEQMYLLRAMLLERGVTYDNLWPPGQSLFLFAVLRLGPFDELRSEIRETEPLETGGRKLLRPVLYKVLYRGGLDYLTAVRRVQSLLGTLSVLLVFLMARAAFDRRTALVAAIVYGFYPTLVAFCHLARAETLYLFLVTGSLALLLSGIGTTRRWLVPAAGVVWGLSCLVRTIGLTIVPLFLLVFLADRTRAPGARIRAWVGFALGVALGIAPWTIRNYAEYQRLVPVDFSAGSVMYESHNAYVPPNFDRGMRSSSREYDTDPPLVDRPRSPARNPVERTRDEIDRALQFNLEHPGLALRRVARKLVEFWAPTSFLVGAVNDDKFRYRPSETWRRAIILATVISYVLLVAAAVVGFFRLRPGPFRALCVAMIGGTYLVHALTQACSRYRIPLLPIFCVLAAVALIGGVDRQPQTRSRWVGIVLVLLPLLAAMGWLLTRYDLLELRPR